MKTLIIAAFLLTSVRSFGQWTPVNVNMSSDFVDVQFINDSIGFVTGANGTILKTTDYGTSWLNTNNTGSLAPFKIHFADDSVGYALSFNDLFKTFDQGSTWIALPYIQSYDKSNLFFLNDSTGFFLSAYGAIHKTTDGGMNWTVITTNCGGTIVEEDVYFPDQNTGYFGGWYGTCASRTTDGGNTWQVLPNNLLYIIKAIHFPSVSTGYMAGWLNAQSGGIQKTTDNGDTWVIQNTPSWQYTSVYCIDTNTCYAVGPSGVISKTTDGGANWQQQYSGTLQGLRKIYCTDANTCYAVGDSGTVLKTTNGGVTGLTNDLPALSGISILPNPANDKFTINLTSSNFEVEVFNAMGRIVAKIKNQNQVDVSNYADGIYFVKAFDGQNYYCKKVIVEHE